MLRSSLLLIVISFVLSQSAFADAPRCSAIFTDPNGITRTWGPSKIPEDQVKVVSITNLPAVLDQGRRGFCWLYGTFNNLMNRSLQRTGQDPKLSIFYISYYHWLKQALLTATDPAKAKVQEGGTMAMAINLINEHGMITQDEWAALGGSTTIQLPENDLKEMPQLTAIITRAHDDKVTFQKWIKPDLSANATPEQKQKYYDALFGNRSFVVMMENMLIEKQQQIARGEKSAFNAEMIAGLRKMLAQKVRPADEFSGKEISGLMNRLDADTINRVKRFFNRMYFGTDTSPLNKVDVTEAKARAHELFPELQSGVVNFMVSLDRKQAPVHQQGPDGSMYVAVSIEKAQRLAKTFIMNNVPVAISYDHQANFVDTIDPSNPANSGVMSIERLKESPESSYLTRRQRLQPFSYYTPGGHLTLVYSVYLKIKTTLNDIAHAKDIVGYGMINSWGLKVGQQGLFRMESSFFGAQVYQLSVFGSDLQKPGIVEIINNPDIRFVTEEDEN